MSTEDEIRNAVGGLISGSGPRHSIVESFRAGGPGTPEEKVAALEHDVRGLYDALLLLAHRIDDLRAQSAAR